MCDTAFESLNTILFESKTILVIRTHPQELRVYIPKLSLFWSFLAKIMPKTVYIRAVLVDEFLSPESFWIRKVWCLRGDFSKTER